MVAAPCLGVVFKNRAGNSSGNGIPGGAKAFAVADQQIGRVIHVRPGVNAFAVEHTGNADFT